MTDDETPVGAGAVIGALGEVREAIEALAQSNRGEKPAPTIFPIAAVNRTTVKLRVVAWVHCGINGAAVEVALQVGASIQRTVVMSPTLTTLIVPMPITIERGTDVVAVGGEISDSWLIAYTE